MDYDYFDKTFDAPICLLEDNELNKPNIYQESSSQQSASQNMDKLKVYTENELTVSTTVHPQSNFDEEEAITPGTNQDENGGDERPLIRLNSINQKNHHFHHAHHHHHPSLTSGFT